MRITRGTLVLIAAVIGVGAAAPAICASAFHFRLMAEESLARGKYEEAARFFREEARDYYRRGYPNEGKVEAMKAERWGTEMGLYVNAQPDREYLQAHYTGAKYEPLYGCYLGAYALTDYDLPSMRDDKGKRLPAEVVFGKVVGKPLATAFDYCRYGDRFPVNWSKDLISRGIAPHIALEPNDGLQYVKDNEYLRQFARDAASCGGPIFLRFASEMNGNWTAYHANPGLYRAKFRLMHDVMRQLAPNVAMMWCVYQMPEYNIDSYYPGDAYVDWVGINIYSVLHHDGDLSCPSEWESPASMLKYVYSKYASRKPIAICEYAATHAESLSPGTDYSYYANTKLAQMFTMLPREFPRVKLIDIFDCNNIKYSRAGRRINDYAVTDNQWVLNEFRSLISSGYYLSHIVAWSQSDLPTQVRPLKDGADVAGIIRLSAWVKTYEDRPFVVYTIDGRRVAQFGDAPAGYRVEIDTSKYGRGRHVIAVEAYDGRGHMAGRKTAVVYFNPAARDSVYAMNTVR